MSAPFKKAIEHALSETKRAGSWMDLAKKTGVSYDLLKNIKQGKSEKPNAIDAEKIADFFGVSLKDFIACRVPTENDPDAVATEKDVEVITDRVRQLRNPDHRAQVQALAQALLRIEQADQPSE